MGAWIRPWVALAAWSLGGGCAESVRDGDPHDLGPGDLGAEDAGMDEGPDLGEVSPPLGDLELQRTVDGTRLRTIALVLEGLPLEAQPHAPLHDTLLERTCEARANTADRVLRCLAFDISTGFFEDDSCAQPVVAPRGPECGGPWFLLPPPATDASGPPDRVFMETDEPFEGVIASYLSFDDVCIRNDGSRFAHLSGFRRTEPVEDDRFVAGDEEQIARGDLLVERVRRYADGTISRSRELTEPCTAIAFPGETGVTRCVPSVTYARPDQLRFADPSCVDLLGSAGIANPPDAENVVVLDTELRVLQRVGESAVLGESYRLAIDAEGMPLCVLDSSETPILPLGASIDPTPLPRLTPRELGTGAVRVRRWVDEDGVAWPAPHLVRANGHWTPVVLDFVDHAREAPCFMFRTSDEVRCMPLRAFNLRTVDEFFADPACRERLVRAGHAARQGEFVYVTASIDPLCSVASAVTEVWRRGATQTLDEVYVRRGTECVPEPPDPAFTYRAATRVPVTEFPEVELVGE